MASPNIGRKAHALLRTTVAPRRMADIEPFAPPRPLDRSATHAWLLAPDTPAASVGRPRADSTSPAAQARLSSPHTERPVPPSHSSPRPAEDEMLPRRAWPSPGPGEFKRQNRQNAAVRLHHSRVGWSVPFPLSAWTISKREGREWDGREFSRLQDRTGGVDGWEFKVTGQDRRGGWMGIQGYRTRRAGWVDGWEFKVTGQDRTGQDRTGCDEGEVC
jgi:hypothetical protein